MNIAILAPSPVHFAVGGAEHLWLGLQRYLNEETGHNCELFKFPSPGQNVTELLRSYLEPSRFQLDHFDVLLTGKDPAWFIEHADHRIYMLHKLRGLYDTYHFFNEPDAEDYGETAAQRALGDLRRLADGGAGPAKAYDIIGRLVRDIEDGKVDERTLRFPGPFSRELIHCLDDIALSPSRISRYAAISRTVANRTGYFPRAVSAAVAYPPPRLSGFQCKRPEHFFTVSRLDSAKRIDLIIREYAKVKGDVKLFIGGVGPALDDLRAAANGDDRIVFLGKLTDQETLDYYSRSIAVPFTPYDEDYGLITVEAMKSGKPVLTVNDSGGVTELVNHGKNGWCVPNKEGALTRAFEEALADADKTAELGKAAERSVQNITWENVANTLLGEGKKLRQRPHSHPKAQSRKAAGKLVVVSTFGIFPPRGGGQSRIFHLYSKLAETFDVTVVCLVNSQDAPGDSVVAPNLREIRIPKTEAHEQEEANRSKEVGWVPITDIVCGELIRLTPDFEKTLAILAAETDAVIASGPYLIDAIGRAMPHTMLLYEAHNLEIELKRDILPDTPAGRDLLDTVGRVEGACWRDAAMVFACADRDLSSLDKEYGSSAAVQVEVPNGFSPDETPFTGQSDRRALAAALHPKMEKSAIFLGSWHGPNLTAVETILTLAPLFDDVRFLIVGSACLAFKDRPMPENVVCFGIVDEEEKALLLASASVALNPMTEGSGSNLKMLDYFGAGIPVISTHFGARGLSADAGVHFIPAEKNELSMALSQFFAFREAREELVSRAKALAVDHYSWDVIGARFLLQLNKLFASVSNSKARQPS